MAPNGTLRWIPATIFSRFRLLCFSLLVIIFSHSANSSAVVLNNSGAHIPLKYNEKLLQMQSILRKINKPAVKTIQSPDGDIIDCVLIHQQRGFDPNIPIPVNTALSRPFQIWHHSGERCPKGTFPARRTTVEDLMRFQSAGLYGKKPHGVGGRSSKVEKPSDDADQHEYAFGFVSGGPFYGSSAILNVWNPEVANQNEFSLSQTWVFAGSYNDNDLNSVEVGWQVYPRLYGDNNTRLFTYWTTDAYRRTGCYNVLCDGFVQVHSHIALGASFQPISTYNGPQHDINVTVWKNITGDGAWWLTVQRETVGYWPANLFTHLANYSTTIRWGGEIVNTRPNERHTTTEMGSGHYAQENFRKASFTRNMKVADSSGTFEDVPAVQTRQSKSGCYDVEGFFNTDWGAYIYFGGPGFNPNCP